MINTEKTMEKIVALCKGRGFVYAGSEIYGGLANTWDYGPLGVELKTNIKAAWRKKFIQENPYNVGLDSAILMNPQTWVASGHLGGFSDPLMDCRACKTRHRADNLIEDFDGTNVAGWSNEQMTAYIKEHNIPCPECGATDFTDIRQFNLMFKTFQGITEDSKAELYLRPETAQGIFVNFANIQRTSRKKVPFGVAQVGKSFRNEITPGNFIFRDSAGTSLNVGSLTLDLGKTTLKKGDVIRLNVILLPWGYSTSKNDDNVINVRNDTCFDPYKITPVVGTKVEDAFIPSVRAENGTATFKLSGGRNNAAVRVYGFENYSKPTVTFKADGEELEPAEDSQVRVSIVLPEEHSLTGGEFSLLHVSDDGDVVEGQDWTSTAHAFLVEPTFEVGMFDIKTTAFYAIVDRGDAAEDASDLDNGEIPEYFFVYAEPAFKLAEFIKFGIPVEYHTHTLDDDDDTAATFDVGGRIYITPVENLEITAFGMVDVAVQDNEDDNALRFGLETVYSF